MKPITRGICVLFAIFTIAFTNAQTTSSQTGNNTVSVEMQVQIQQALKKQANPILPQMNNAIAPIYVGSFQTNDGPYWETNPPVYSAVEAAALLFGGSPLDYAISTNPNSNDSSTITNTAWYSKWGVAGCHEYAENFSLDLGAPGYNDPTGNDTAISAYVDDNCINGNINYVWQISDSSLFITTWKTDNPGTTNSTSIRIPTVNGETYNYDVSWNNDGIWETGFTGNATHNYATPGTYTVAIRGTFPRIKFGNGGDRRKILSIEQWGNIQWTNMYEAFYGCSNLLVNATDAPDLSIVSGLQYMFKNATSFDSNIGHWDVSNVANMIGMLDGANLSKSNYDALLTGWSSLTLKSNVNFSAGYSLFCSGEAGRTNIINTYGWTILDGGKECSNCTTSTTYKQGSGWNNGVPNSTKKAIFQDDYNTTLGNIDACAIEIASGATLTVSEGTLIKSGNDIEINGELIFLSSASGNGELGMLGATATITGDATVQRYMKNRRSYRIVSSAVTTSTSIHTNWQEGASLGLPNPNPGYGTHITGSINGDNGFDATVTGNPSMFTVNVGTQQFEAITNTDVNTLTAGEAYLLFVRGNRSIDLSDNEASTETTLRALGSLMTGTNTQNFATTAAGNVIMFGNPYQSAININTVFANSINVNPSYYYVYDPTLAEFGSYVTVNLPSGTNTSGSVANHFLQPGQGAQVSTLGAGSASVIFNESDKAPGQFTSSNRNNLAEPGMLTVQLFTTDNFINGGPVHDSFGILFDDNYNNALTFADAVKPMNFQENIGIDHNGTYLSLEQRKMPLPSEIYPLYSSGYTQTNYTFSISVDGLENIILSLDDHFTGSSTILEPGVNSYSFNVDVSDELSIATDRFTIRTELRLGMEDNNLLSGIRIFPNPLNSTTFYINAPNLNGKQVTVSINDLSGRKIFNETLECSSNTLTVPMSKDFASGIYLVTLQHEGQADTYRLIKE